MKYLLSTLIMMLAFFSNAQLLTYSDGMIEYNNEMVKTINIKLDPKPGDVRSSFEKWMDNNYDVDLDGRSLLFFEKEYMSAKGVVIPEVSSRKIDVMVKVDETAANATTLHVFASFGYDNWITLDQYPVEFMALEEIVYEYVADFLPEYYKGKVENTRENLEDLNERKEDLSDDVKDNEEEIAKLKKENQELRVKMQENQKKINNAKAKLVKRDKELKSVKRRVKN